MAETVMEKEQYCQHECNEFQHITLLNTKDKDQFLFMGLFTTALYRLPNTHGIFSTPLCTDCLELLLKEIRGS